MYREGGVFFRKYPSLHSVTRERARFVDGMIMRFTTLAVMCVVAFVQGLPFSVATADERRPLIGDEIKSLRFKDIRYLPRTLTEFGDRRAYVIVFTNTTCPLAQKYWPKLKRLDAEYRDQQVQFLSVNASQGDDLAEIAQQALDFGVEFPCVQDVDGSCVRTLGVERTPEVVILDGQRRLRYRGRIDDQYRLGGSRIDVTADDLVLALNEVLQNKPVTQPETEVDGCKITLPAAAKVATPVTFYEHVLPLMQRHCQECHHTGGGAPFALMTLDDVTAHAEMVAEVVAEQRMPPWYGSRRQHFDNERGLSVDERKTITQWAATGCLPGDVTQAPPARLFQHGKWQIGKPDLVTTSLLPHSLPAEGFVDYKYVILPYIFTQDTWISGAEILPSNPAVVHHCNMGYVTLGEEFHDRNLITGRVPGGTPLTLEEGVALKIPKNSVIGLQIHYTTTGKPETNNMSVGFRFPRAVIRQELQHLQVSTSRFEIPPGASAHPVSAVRTLPANASGLGMFAHMHLRGKDMTFQALYPDGARETLLSIPNYHYDWQQNYRWKPGTRKFPEGTQIEVIAHFDNSKFNPFNPDATQTVRNGPQTVQEMMFGFFFYTREGEDLNLTINPKTGHRVDIKK